MTVNDRRKAGGWADQEVAELAATEVQNSGSYLVIVNTKASARRIFELCASVLASPMLFFTQAAQICPAHRKTRLAALVSASVA